MSASDQLINFIKDQENFSIIVMVVIAIVGFIIKIVFDSKPSKDGISGPAYSNIYGYSIIAFSILCGIFLSFSLAIEKDKNDTNESKNKFSVLKLMFMKSFQPLLLFFILVWILSININYYTKINKGQVTETYDNFSGIFTFLVTAQTIILFIYLNSDEPRRKILSNLLYILSSLNIVLLVIMNIIMRFFTTDG